MYIIDTNIAAQENDINPRIQVNFCNKVNTA